MRMKNNIQWSNNSTFSINTFYKKKLEISFKKKFLSLMDYNYICK